MFPTELGSPSEDSFVYMTYNSPLLSPGEPSGTFDMYQAQRSADGWQTTRRLSPSGAQAVLPYPGGVSRDHRYTFTNVSPIQGGAHPGGSLSAEGTSDYLGSPDGSFELTGIGSLGSERLAQGRYINEGGGHVIFITGDLPGQSMWCSSSGEPCQVRQLEPDAAPTGTGAVYDRGADGLTHVVSLLPGEVTPAAGQEAFYQGTSKDATAVAFKISGALYVRVDNAATLEVTKAEATYAGLSDDGRYLFYVTAGDIHRFDIEGEKDDQVNATGNGQVVNVSADGSHVYFISESQIGGKGTVGQPNMYVWSGSTPEYIATVLPGDLAGVPALANWTNWAVNPVNAIFAFGGPGGASSRATPDGTVLAFESRAQLTAYDNAGHTEIYRFDDEDNSLTCVSCNPMAEPATDDARFQELELVLPAMVIHNLSSDGSRVFFESAEAMVAEDTDGINDIYQWHEEEGSAFLDLISSGRSVDYPPLLEQPQFLPSPNILLSVTPTGSDVFFFAQEELVPRAGGGGTQAIYNARVGGGFPEPSVPPICIEEGCRSAPSSPPSLLGPPQSEGTQGSGNVKPRKRKPHCRRAKHRKHRHCARKKAQRWARSATSSAQAVEEGSGNQPSAAPSNEVASAASQVSTASVSALAGGDFDEFEIKALGAEESTTAAGAHPDFTVSFELTHQINKITGFPEAEARPEEISVSLPPGLLGNVNTIPRCSTGQFVAFGNCPIDSQVGVAEILATGFGNGTEPIYNLEPSHPEKEIARFGFFAILYPVFVDVKVRTASDYGVTATVHSPPAQAALLKSKTTLWGNPAHPSHDSQRMTSLEALQCPSATACKAPEEKRESGLSPTAFISNPSACQDQSVGLTVKSYQLPGQVFSKSAPMAPITNCTGLPFDPSLAATATNPVAGAPTGLKTTLVIPQASMEAVNSPSTSTMREARVALPEGMTIAAGAADGIATCSDEQVGYKQEVNAACPDTSKIGGATISSQLLPKPIQAEIFLRTQRPGHIFGLWLVSDDLGLHVKIPGEIEPDKQTGRLTAVFGDLPQVPVEQIDLNVWGGPRAPLKNPDYCGTYATSYTFAPHSSDPAVSGQSQMTIDQGCNQGFSPILHAGVTNPVAGHFSPFVFDLTRQDGEQALRGFELHLPKGELAKLAGVPLCPDGAVASGSCPQSSKIGRLIAAAGPGPAPLWIPQPGKPQPAIYLSGPYHGAPFSIVSEVPAQAGPFDLGVLVVRSGLEVDPESAQATVEADPLPQFFEGVGIAYRRLHAVIDRPGFSLNPTNCRELAVTSDVTSTQGTVATPAARFQVDGCKALRFKPKLSLKMRGGTERAEYPALTAVVKARRGDANIGRVSVALPPSEFLAQEHLVTICTRKRFAAGKCPKGSIYGRAKAWTPLLDKPLQGPVYLRSSDNPLPDLVMALGGKLDIHLVGRIDSKGRGIRTTFDSVPDAPITRFVLRMKGGAKGLLVNSTDVCRGTHRATVRMRAQNGRRADSRPALESRSCGRG